MIINISPRRTQRYRRKGFTLPAGAIYVGRPTPWTNPFAASRRAEARWGHAKSVILHKEWLNGRIGALTLERFGFHPAEIDALDRRRCWVLTNLHRLHGRDLACWCPLSSQWCHAETLLAMAPVYAEYDRIAA